MGVFDEILARVAPEDRAVLAKYPDLQASITKMENDLGAVSNYATKWVNWQNDNWDSQSGMTRAEKALRDELESAQAKLSAGIEAGASTATVAALRKEFETKLAETQKQSMSAIEGMNHFYSSVSSRLLSHQQEFKDPLEAPKLMAFMQANKINDPDLAYDKMVAGRRAELAVQSQKDLETKHAADITAAEQRGREQRSQELAMGPNGVMPTDSTGGIVGVTSRIDQPAKISDDVKSKIGDAKVGDGSLAQLGYELYRQGAFSVT